MLRYAIKSQEGHQPETPTQLFDIKQRVPEAPAIKKIDVLVAGFPWYVQLSSFPLSSGLQLQVKHTLH